MLNRQYMEQIWYFSRTRNIEEFFEEEVINVDLVNSKGLKDCDISTLIWLKLEVGS